MFISSQRDHFSRFGPQAPLPPPRDPMVRFLVLFRFDDRLTDFRLPELRTVPSLPGSCQEVSGKL